jgi:hypothetical protein
MPGLFDVARSWPLRAEYEAENSFIKGDME